jgi:hypothetical protein
MTLTRREVFEKVKTHLLTQGRKSEDLRPSVLTGFSVETCLYRGPDGTKCAAGALIADEHYAPALETHTVDHECVQTALTSSGVPLAAIGLVRELQFIHDARPIHKWADELDRVEGYL